MAQCNIVFTDVDPLSLALGLSPDFVYKLCVEQVTFPL